MNLKKKKKLIARVLGIGIGRVKLNNESGEEIKEAITRQDIRDLKKEGLIKIKEKRGIKRKLRKKTREREGSRKRARREENYTSITRKLRNHIKNLKVTGKLTKEEYYNLRKKIKSRMFQDINHLKQEIKQEIKRK